MMVVTVSVAFLPERFWLVPACEPSTLLAAFLERFQSACLLAQQLPAMKPEQLKSMVRNHRHYEHCSCSRYGSHCGIGQIMGKNKLKCICRCMLLIENMGF